MLEENEKTIINDEIINMPLSFFMLGAGVAGVKFEIIPFLLKEVKTQQELDLFVNNMMDIIGDIYSMPLCGSALWVIYKYYCNKDIQKFLKCANTKEKLNTVQEWLIKYLPPSINPLI